MSRYPHDAKVYVGDLGNNASKQELEDSFGYYGPLRNVWVARNPPGFAFVEFEDARDAEDSVRGLDGRTVCGRRCRVELSTGKTARFRSDSERDRDRSERGDRSERSRGESRRSSGRGGSDRRSDGGRPFHPDDRCYECGDRGHYARDCGRYGRKGGKRR
jgi:splicing factor, arginine/serine-rich 7